MHLCRDENRLRINENGQLVCVSQYNRGNKKARVFGIRNRKYIEAFDHPFVHPGRAKMRMGALVVLNWMFTVCILGILE